MSEADIKSDAVLKETECAEEGAQQVRLTVDKQAVDEPTVDVEDTRDGLKAFAVRLPLGKADGGQLCCRLIQKR